MRPTIEYIQTRFDEYNTRFFGGTLPPLPVKLSHAKGFLGKVTFTRRRRGLFGRYHNEDFVLRINVRIDLPETVVEDTILHEMIHYYIAVNEWHDTSTHGELFRREMARINQTGGRHITISHRLNEEEQAQAQVRKGRIVAVLHLSDGRTGIKIVPKQIRHILYWHQKATKVFGGRDGQATIEWYYTAHPFFANYPSSIAMKVYIIEKPDTIPLDDAHRLLVTDRQVRLQKNPNNSLKW